MSVQDYILTSGLLQVHVVRSEAILAQDLANSPTADRL